MSKIKRELPDNLKVKWLPILIPFAAVIVLGIIIASVKYFGTERFETNAEGRIELNWKGASEGIAPNGEGYDLLRVDNSVIIAEAITRLGLNTTVDEVKNNLVISGQYPKDIIGNITNMRDPLSAGSSEKLEVTQFHPSAYTVSLKNNFKEKLSRKVLSQLLSEIMAGYYNDFFSQYTIGYQTTIVDGVLDASQYDYEQILSVLSYRISLVEKNAKTLSELDSLYRYNKQSFADMAVIAEKLISTELNRAQADCVVHGLSKDYKSMLQSYYYSIRSLQLELTEAEANLTNITEVIDGFERDQSAFVSSGLGVEYQQGNSNKTYEELMNEKTECSEKISEVSSRINYYEELVENIKSSVYLAQYDSYCASLEQQIESLFIKCTELEKSMSEMIGSYNETEIGDDALVVSAVKVNHPKVISGGFIVALIKSCGPLCMLVLIYALAMELRRRILIDRMFSEEM